MSETPTLQEQNQGKTENGQPQEPEPSREATVFLVAAEKRGKHGTLRRYIMAPDGSLLHTDHDSLVPIMRAAIAAGYRKVVAEELEAKGDHFARIFTVTMTPPRRGAATHPERAPVPAVDPARSTPNTNADAAPMLVSEPRANE